MATDIVKNYKSNLIALQNNPTAVHALGIQLIRDSSAGLYDLVDCTNPAVMLMESTAVSVSAALEQMAVLNRKQYKIAAQNMEDLYPHMSDKDMGELFALPSTTKFVLIFSMEELGNSLVFDSTTGNSKLTIPRNTNFTLAGLKFSMQYPVEITRMTHGEYTVLYDVDNPSPIKTLSTNVVPTERKRKSMNEEFMALYLDVEQFSINSQQSDINDAQELVMNIPMTDQYYYCRVYFGGGSSGWTEMRTTHTAEVYDVTTPTAVLRVLDSSVVITLPQIYVTKNMVSGKLRVDVYETKGPVLLDLSGYSMDATVVEFLSIDTLTDNTFSAPLMAMRQIQAFSPYKVDGGSNKLPFASVQKRVIENTTNLQDRAITNVDLPTVLETKGYEIVANYDLITNRVFLATREMPVPTNQNLITAAATSIVTVASTIGKLTNWAGVKDNGDSITITPDVLYQIVNGTVSLVPDSALAAVLALAPEQRALVVTNGNYYYTPFHYVLDMTNNEFALRAYYLDKPAVETKSYIAENDTTLLNVSTETYIIDRTPTGYKLSIITQSTPDFQELPDDEVFVQLAFVPAGEKDYAYLNGVMTNKIDGERVFSFNLDTNFNVDSNNNIELTKFGMYTTEPRIVGAALTTTFEILYSVSSLMGPLWIPNGIDRVLGTFLLPTRIAGVTRETLRVNFGTALKTLWSRARSVVESVDYKTWDVDVMAVYENDVFERDPSGSIIQIVDGKVVTKKLHSKGDPVIDPQTGLQEVKFAKGTVMLDNLGNPLPGDGSGLERQFDLLLIDGTYWFATDAISKAYRQEMTDTMVGWITGDLTDISKRLLEQTKLYYYPKVNTGYMDVMIEDGSVISMPANQSFSIDFVVDPQVYSNIPLRKQLERIGIKTLSEALSQPTYAADQVEGRLRELCGDDFKAVTVSGMGGSKDYKYVEVVDNATRFSLHKRLFAQTDETLIVQESVVITFIPHVRKV